MPSSCVSTRRALSFDISLYGAGKSIQQRQQLLQIFPAHGVGVDTLFLRHLVDTRAVGGDDIADGGKSPDIRRQRTKGPPGGGCDENALFVGAGKRPG